MKESPGMSDKGKSLARVSMDLPCRSEEGSEGEGNKDGRLGFHGDILDFCHRWEMGPSQLPLDGSSPWELLGALEYQAFRETPLVILSNQKQSLCDLLWVQKGEREDQQWRQVDLEYQVFREMPLVILSD